VLLAAALIVACRRAPARPPIAPLPAPPPGDTSCIIAAGPPSARDTVMVAFTEPIDPAHAPLPRNDAERVAFSQLYQTLIRVDCVGRPLPGLAQSWEHGEGWTFTLRGDARFWDGAPVTARDVLASWRATDPLLARTATATGERALTVASPGASLERLADPALAVTKPAPGGGWPIGTGDYWATNADGDTPAVLWARAVPGVARPVLKLTTVAANSARDALDEGVDLLVTSDPAAREYAGTRPEYVDAPLDWNRSYVLLAPGGNALNLAGLRRESLPQAVRVEGRPAEGVDGGPFWFEDLHACDLRAVRDTTAPRPARRRVVYSQADRGAADLSARLVGLGVLGQGAVATGLSPGAFELALRAGNEAAYLIPLRRRVFDRCRAALELPAWSGGARIVPLIDTRSHALVRRGLPRLAIDWDGTLRFVP
jgi:extracellular solute-binding protein (family 5)